MVFHIVLFRPRADLSAGDRSALAGAFQTAAVNIPSIRRLHIGRRVTHGRAYEQAMTEKLEYAAVLEFDNLAGLKAYLEHPLHAELGSRFLASIGAAVIYDYEMEEGAGVGEIFEISNSDGFGC